MKTLRALVKNKKNWGKTVKVVGKRKRVSHWNITKDKDREAKKPGWRISRRGKIYYENRTNRSDKKGKI